MSDEQVQEATPEVATPETAPADVAPEATPETAPADETPVDASQEASASLAAESPAEEVKTFYQGVEVVQRLGNFDQNGAEECKLADGTTTFVPKEVLGE